MSTFISIPLFLGVGFGVGWWALSVFVPTAQPIISSEAPHIGLPINPVSHVSARHSPVVPKEDFRSRLGRIQAEHEQAVADQVRSALAEDTPESKLQSALQLTGLMRREVTDRVLNVLFEDDPGTALSAMLALHDPIRILENYLTLWLEADYPAAAAWVGSQNGAIGDWVLLRSLMATTNGWKIAATQIDGLQLDAFSRSFVSTIADRFVDNDPAHAMEWAESLKTASTREIAISVIKARFTPPASVPKGE